MQYEVKPSGGLVPSPHPPGAGYCLQMTSLNPPGSPHRKQKSVAWTMVMEGEHLGLQHTHTPSTHTHQQCFALKPLKGVLFAFFFLFSFSTIMAHYKTSNYKKKGPCVLESEFTLSRTTRARVRAWWKGTGSALLGCGPPRYVAAAPLNLLEESSWLPHFLLSLQAHKSL